MSSDLVDGAQGLAIITAAGHSQNSYGDPASRHEFFTKHLLAAITGEADKPPFGNYDSTIATDEASVLLFERVEMRPRAPLCLTLT